MRQGLKRVAHRRDDALTGVRWDRLEHLLAACYRDADYQVEHVGAGALAGWVELGVDLKLEHDGRVLLVRIKHWNACKLPRSDMHQLIGLRSTRVESVDAAPADGRPFKKRVSRNSHQWN
ncbi:restriction endonuclease [Luteimonas sp. SMYT11W]|uniref:Restriction endonuclease n=1 Tax=Luteimonas flava TaxID=3115822 RepID=A0ABU7WCI0_9GAMM